MRTAVIDFDDLCDTNNPLESLLLLKKRDPGFKVTLFAIPTRCSGELFRHYMDEEEWIQLGVHGWRHARHECLAWTSEETTEKLQEAIKLYPRFAHIFKAPNWEVCDEVYAGCKKAGFAIADHIRNIQIMPADMPNYIYNIRLRNDEYLRMHGHIQDWNKTGLTENANGKSNGKDTESINERYLLPVGTPYAFASEAVAPNKTLAL